MDNTLNRRPSIDDPLPDFAEDRTMTLEEVAFCAGTSALIIQQLVEEELISPVIEDDTGKRFDAAALHRIVKALRIHGYLGVELQSLNLIMQLLDRIERLEAELHRLRNGSGN